MIQRSISSAALIGGIAQALWLLGVQGGIWILTLAALLTQYEIYRLFRRTGVRPLWRLGLASGALLMLGSYYLPLWSRIPSLRAGSDLMILGVIACSIGVIVVEREQAFKFRSLVATLFGLLYVPFMLHFLVVLVHHSGDPLHGIMAGLWLIATAKVSDIGGLLTGMVIGRTRLAPHLSPGKTWEGAAGGVLCSVAVGGIFAWLAGQWMPPAFGPWEACLLAIPTGVFAIVSDLVESLFKRQAGVKDSGSMVPGIGGAFDVTDSLILTAPFGYFVFSYIIA